MAEVGIRGRSGPGRLDHHSLAQNGGHPGSKWRSRWWKGPHTLVEHLDYFLLLLHQVQEIKLKREETEVKASCQVDLLNCTH